MDCKLSCDSRVGLNCDCGAAQTRVVNLKYELYDVFIGRPSKWGNPFKLTKDTPKLRKDCVDKYKEWILNNPDLLGDLHELKHKTMGCYCKPKPCHGDVLVELVRTGGIKI